MAQQTYGEYMRSNPPIPNLTAVEWLVQKYFNDYNVLIPELEYEQAKQMEKEQIVNAWMATDNELQRLAAEQYYNETYGNKS